MITVHQMRTVCKLSQYSCASKRKGCLLDRNLTDPLYLTKMKDT